MKPHVKYALIGTGFSTLWTLIGYLMGNESQESLKWVGWAVILAISIFCFRGAILEVRIAKNGFISFKEAFKICFMTALIMCFINSVFSYFYFAYINPDFVTYILDKAQQDMIDKGLSDEQVEMTIAMQEKFMSPMMMGVWGFVAMIIFNALVGLVTAAVMKKENPDDVFGTNG